MINRKILKENEKLKLERDNYHQIWVDEHAVALQHKDTISKLSTRLIDLDSRVYIGESTLKRDDEIAADAKEKLTEYKIDASKYKVESQRLKADCEKLVEKNVSRII